MTAIAISWNSQSENYLKELETCINTIINTSRSQQSPVQLFRLEVNGSKVVPCISIDELAGILVKSVLYGEFDTLILDDFLLNARLVRIRKIGKPSCIITPPIFIKKQTVSQQNQVAIAQETKQIVKYDEKGTSSIRNGALVFFVILVLAVVFCCATSSKKTRSKR